jgi:hypothetical protein
MEKVNEPLEKTLPTLLMTEHLLNTEVLVLQRSEAAEAKKTSLLTLQQMD